MSLLHFFRNIFVLLRIKKCDKKSHEIMYCARAPLEFDFHNLVFENDLALITLLQNTKFMFEFLFSLECMLHLILLFHFYSH